MPFQKTKLSSKEILIINKRINSILLLIMLFFICILFTSFLLYYFYINKYENFFLILDSIFTVTFILICFSLFLDILNLKNDLNDSIKLVGSASIIGKDFSRSNRGIKYYILFNESIIGKRYVSHQFWKTIEVGRTFSIQQLPNSRLIFNFESENINFLDELTQDINLQNY